MGLTQLMARAAARRAHVLVVEVPGSWRIRVAAERAVLARGWCLAVAPADADVLLVCGRPGPRLAEAVERVWHQLPGPRVRVDLRDGDDAVARLGEAHAGLLDTGAHRHDARHRPSAAEQLGQHGEDDGGHGDMDHGDMDMSPGGIPLAEGGEDRDGLEMDVLKVRLGPVLPHWPAGLVLHCSLQGDVIVAAHAELLDEEGGHRDEVGGRARRLDGVASLLALAGWDDAASQARRVRDAVLDGEDEAAHAGLASLRRRVRRSRTLRWSLRGLGPVTEQVARRHGLPSLTGDSHDRLIGMLDRAGGADADVEADASSLSTDQLAGLATGLDLGTARLVVASLDVPELRDGRTDREVAHG